MARAMTGLNGAVAGRSSKIEARLSHKQSGLSLAAGDLQWWQSCSGELQR